jgi:hypothetical protein
LNERQKTWLRGLNATAGECFDTLKGGALSDGFRRRSLVTIVLFATLSAEIVLVWFLDTTVKYAGSRTTGLFDVIMAEMLLFGFPLALSTIALFRLGPLLIAWLAAAPTLLRWIGRCLLSSLVALLLAIPAVGIMDLTFDAFGPRALLDWSDARLWIYAAEYTVSAVLLDGMIVSILLLVLGLSVGAIAFPAGRTLRQTEWLVTRLGRYSGPALLGGGTIVASIAALIKDLI